MPKPYGSNRPRAPFGPTQTRKHPAAPASRTQARAQPSASLEDLERLGLATYRAEPSPFVSAARRWDAGLSLADAVRQGPTRYPMYGGSGQWDTGAGWLGRAVNQNRAGGGLAPLPAGRTTSSPMRFNERAIPDELVQLLSGQRPQEAFGQALGEFGQGRAMQFNQHMVRPGPGMPAWRDPDFMRTRQAGAAAPPSGVETGYSSMQDLLPSLNLLPGDEEAMARQEAAQQAQALQAEGMAATHAAYDPMAQPLPYAASIHDIPGVQAIGTEEGIVYRAPMSSSGRYAPTSREEFTAKTRENIEAQKRGLPGPHNVQYRGRMEKEGPYTPDSTWAGLTGGTTTQPSPVEATGPHEGESLADVLFGRRKALRGERVPMAQRQRNVRAKRRGISPGRLAAQETMTGIQDKIAGGEPLSEYEQTAAFGQNAPYGVRLGALTQLLGLGAQAGAEGVPQDMGWAQDAMREALGLESPEQSGPFSSLIERLDPLLQDGAREAAASQDWATLRRIAEAHGIPEEELEALPEPAWKKLLPFKRTAGSPLRITRPYQQGIQRIRRG